MWGETAGMNFFNPSANTSVFPKVDVTSGDDVDGVGGKAGMGVFGKRPWPGIAALPAPAIQLDFGQLRDHSAATYDAEGALWRRKRCSNFRGW